MTHAAISHQRHSITRPPTICNLIFVMSQNVGALIMVARQRARVDEKLLPLQDHLAHVMTVACL